MPQAAACPDLTKYQKLVAGQLADADEEALLKHLESCEVCAQKLTTLAEPDTLVGLIRHAETLVDRATDGTLARLVDRLSKLRPGEAPAGDKHALLPREPAPGAAVAFACPACGERLTVKAGLAGKKVKCPHCKESVRVPASAGGTSLAEAGILAPVKPAARGAATASYHAVETPAKELYDFLAPPQAADEIGRLGPYRVLAVLGAGGMGVVFRAEDPQLNRLVALKAMLPSMACAESGRQRFVREARATAAIKHDHIVSVYQVGEDRGVPFLAMEFLEGEPLDTRLTRDGKLPVVDVLRFGREIALGLAAAHKRGLIHRDIKPANLWVEAETGRIKVLDFGLARAAKEASPLTQSGAIVGTPEYMAPEQVQGKDLDERCDLFSLGCVLYRMSTGQMPFTGTDMISTLRAVATEKPRAPRDLVPGLPAALSKLIMRLLAKEPGKRPESAQAVAEALQELQKRAKDGPKTARPRPSWFGKKKHPVPWLIGMAGGLVAAVLMGIVLYWPTPRGLVKIESDDPSVEIVFDKTGPTVKGAGKEPITLRAGEHGVLIKRGDFEFETDKFVVEKDQTVTLKVELLPGKMQVVQANRVIGQKSMPQPPGGTVPAAADPDRRAAEWVLAIDGTVKIILKETDEKREIKAREELPRGAFELTFVNLNENKKVSDAGLARIEDCKNLTGLELYSTKVSDAGLAHLKDCKNLTWLQLAYTQVSDGGLAYLKDCTNLAYVDLSDTQVSDTGLAHLKNCKELAHVHLGGTKVSDAWLAHLKDYKSLTWLHLGSTQVSDMGLAHIKDCKNLTQLNLNGTQVTDAGLMPLQGMSNLRHLEFVGTKMTDAGLVHLKRLTDLELLNCAGTKLTGAGLVHIEGMTKLQVLRLDNTEVTDEGLVHLKGLHGLRELWLNQTRVTDAGLEHLAGLKNLAQLNLKGTAVTDKGVAKLKAALPKCELQGSADGQLIGAKELPVAPPPPGLSEEAWLKRVEGNMPDAVAKRLRELNPDFDGKIEYKVEDGQVVSLEFMIDSVKDISPVRALRGLRKLSCQGSFFRKGQLADLTPLKGMKLTVLTCNSAQVADLSPLHGMPLTYLECAYNSVTDLSPLKDMNLTYLNCRDTPVRDLSPLKGMPLTKLNCCYTQVSDLSPLKEMKLTVLSCAGEQVTDAGLMPLQGMSSLRRLELVGTKMTDAGLAHLKKLTDLELLNCAGTKLTGAGLVHIEGMTKLQILRLDNSDVTDEGLVHLKGMHGLRELWLNQTRVTDAGLEHLAGLKDLVELNVKGTAVTDKGVAKLKAALPKCNITR